MTNSKDAQTGTEVDLKQNSTGLQEEYLYCSRSLILAPATFQSQQELGLVQTKGVRDRLCLVLLGVNIAQFILTSVECQASLWAAAGLFCHSSVPRFAA